MLSLYCIKGVSVITEYVMQKGYGDYTVNDTYCT